MACPWATFRRWEACSSRSALPLSGWDCARGPTSGPASGLPPSHWFIAFAGGTMTIGYLMGAPLLYGGNVIPVAALAALGFVILGSGLTAAAGEDVVPLNLPGR